MTGHDPRRDLPHAASIGALRAGVALVRAAIASGGAGRPSALFVAGGRRLRPRAAAVLPAVGAAGAVLPAALPEGTADRRRRWRPRSRPRQLLTGDEDIATYTDLCRPGLAALLARPQSAAAQRGLRRDRHRRQGRRGARADQGEDRTGGRGRHAVEARVRVDRFNFGPPVGFPVQFRVIGTGYRRRCARSPTRSAT